MRSKFYLLLLPVALLKAEAIPTDLPWLTGPLLSPAPYVIPPGYINVEPYIFVFDYFGEYDSNGKARNTPDFWTVNPELPIEVGVCKDLSFIFTPQAYYNRSQGASSFIWGDFNAGFNYQLYDDTLTKKWYPSVKLTLREDLPVGKYQHLNPKKNFTDSGGTGSWGTIFGFIFGKQIHFSDEHYLATRLGFATEVFSSVKVSGFNTYGGDKTTRGTVHPGTLYGSILGLEYTLNKNWGLTIDILNTTVSKTTFSGRTCTPNNQPSSTQWSLSPAIEYNFSKSMGIIAGSWFSVAGRNSDQFASFVIAFNFFGPYRKENLGNKPPGVGGGGGEGGGGRGGR